MVGHHAVRIDLTAKFGFPLAQIVEIIKIVLITGKDFIPVMTALNNMMGVVWKDYS
jgi:hypothetical protein